MNKLITQTTKLILKYKWSFLLGVGLIIAKQIFANFAQLYIKTFFDAIEPFDMGKIESALIGYGILTVLYVSLTPIANILHDNYLIKAARDLKIKVFDKLHELDFEFHAEKRSGSIISMIRRGDGAFWSFNIEIFRGLLRILVDLIFISIVFTSLDTRLGAIILVSFLINLIGAFIMIKKNVKSRSRLNDEEDKISGIIGDNLINYDTVNIFAQEEMEQKRLRRQYKGWVDAVWSYANTFRLIELWTGMLFLISIILIVYVGVDRLQANDFTTGDFAITMTYSFSFFPRLGDLIFRFRELAKNYTDLEKYLNLLEEPINIKEIPNAQPLKVAEGKIEFRNIDFRYNEDEPILNGINLTIQPKETIAFVGKSGAGKTTLTKLLMRFYDPIKGEILIDNQDIKEVKKESLRSQISLVPQEALLFNNSIEFNMKYANPKASKEDVKEAARLAHLDTFIENLPKGYNTLVGERGIKLSGGQKQRLAIARAFIEDSPIIIFDEATSQLDSESEHTIQESFWKLAENKTTIIIAHRLSTIMKADRIIVLDSGRITEMGKHEELISKKKGIYKSLWNLQTGTLKE